MTEYAVYLDDSGHPSDQPYVVVAGFLSTKDGWTALESEWKAAVERHKLGCVFHMTDFHGKRPRREEGKVLEDLTGITVRHAQGAFSVIVEMNAYKKLNELYALEECLGTPYAVAARTVAKGINVVEKEILQTHRHSRSVC
jgi:hypothetical protein